MLDTSFGADKNGMYDIEVIPGDADRVLVVYSTSPLHSNTGTALLLDAGVPIGAATPSYVSADETAVRDATTAYAYDATSTGASLYTLALSAAGVTVAKGTNGVLDDFARDFSFDGQWLVTAVAAICGRDARARDRLEIGPDRGRQLDRADPAERVAAAVAPPRTGNR